MQNMAHGGYGVEGGGAFVPRQRSRLEVGNLENGDLITSSGILGAGIKQEGDLSTFFTDARVTCDSTFDLYSDGYESKEFVYVV
jgi:hypothetical protein